MGGLTALILASAIGFVVACGGGSDDAPVGVATGGGVPASGSVANPPQSVTGAGLPSGNSLNVANVAATLEEVESFRFNFKLKLDVDLGNAGSDDDAALAAMFLALLGNIEAEGAFVAPDRSALTMNVFGMDIETITIGEESWTNDGSGWTLDSSDDGFDTTFSMPFDFSSPGMPFDFLPDEDLAGAKITDEKVNGFQTKRYSFDKDSLQSLAASMGDQAGIGDVSDLDKMTLDIWVTEDGVPVKMVISGSGESEGTGIAIDLEFNIKDLNDDSITIERPI
jgi:hypothetical protein